MAEILHQLTVRATRQKLFQAVSTPAGLDAWWTKRSSGEAVEGSEYELFFSSEYDWRAVVSKSLPDSMFELKITDSHDDWLGTVVGFSLRGDGGVTQVRFHHRGWRETNEHFRVSSYCWAIYLRLLKRYVELGEVIAYEDRLDA